EAHRVDRLAADGDELTGKVVVGRRDHRLPLIEGPSGDAVKAPGLIADELIAHSRLEPRRCGPVAGVDAVRSERDLDVRDHSFAADALHAEHRNSEIRPELALDHDTFNGGDGAQRPLELAKDHIVGVERMKWNRD